MKSLLIQILRIGSYSRFKSISRYFSSIITPKAESFSPSDTATRILVGGDVTFDHEIRNPPNIGINRINCETSKFRTVSKIRRLFLRLCQKILISRNYYTPLTKYKTFKELMIKNHKNGESSSSDLWNHKYTRFNIHYPPNTSVYSYPFEKIAPLMQSKDVVLVNLESPLSDHKRAQGFFISEPQYAKAMREAGISIVSLANNHVFDAGEIGFLETLCHLDDARIVYTGAGTNLEDARSGKLIQINKMKIIFLSYTQYCNHQFTSVASEYPGILPVDRQLILEDLKAARMKGDLVFICLHWGFENQASVHPKQTEIAHLLIDAGADAIIGHHPHVPHGIEIYKKRPILYSLGNFIFGISFNNWINDNCLVEIVIHEKCIQGLIIYPISGRGQELFQPEVLKGDRADSMLKDLQIKSEVFNTGIAVRNHVGYVRIQ